MTADDADARDEPETRRLFVALPVAEAAADRLDAALAPLRDRRDVRWTRPDGWHLTLAFLGDVAEPTAEIVAAAGPALRATAGRLGVAAPGVRLSLGPAASFGGRTLHVEVDSDPPDAVEALGEAAQQGLEDAGLPVARRPVTGHVTVGRGRGRRKVPRALVAAVPPVEATWTVDAAVLYRSRLGRGPARYEVEAVLPLVG